MSFKLIAVEGIDGAGKTTVCEVLGQKIRGLYVTGEMRSTLGPLLRDSLAILTPIEKVFWFAADRASLLADVDRRLRETGAPAVLWDRYVDSARAYRWAEVELGCASAEVLELVEGVNAAFPPADLVIYLDLNVDVAEKRLGKRRAEADPRLPLALAYYRRRAAADPSYLTVAADRPRHDVAADVIKGVAEFLR